MFKKIIITILIFVALVGGIFFLFEGGMSDDKAQVSLIRDNLIKVAELATLRYEYKNVIISRTDKNLLPKISDIKYAEAIRLIEYTGYLKAGTDFTAIEVEYDETAGKMFVTLPHSRILDNVVQTESVVVQDVKRNIFASYPTQIIFEEINENKRLLEQEKIGQGFLLEADRCIEAMVKSFLQIDGIENVEVAFKD